MKRAFLLVSALIMIAIVYVLWNDKKSSLEEKIINQDQYSLRLINSQEEVSFEMDKDWIPSKHGDRELNRKIQSTESTDIYLVSIRKDEQFGTIFFLVELRHNFSNKENGKFLYTMKINEDRTFSTGAFPAEWSLFDKDHQAELLSSGVGSGGMLGVHISQEELDKLDRMFTVRYIGLLLYEYTREQGDVRS